MTAKLKQSANEQSTFAVEVSFFDETGAALIPTAVTWTLTDNTKVVVNGRVAVSITPASTVIIVLSGDDLIIGQHDKGRYLLIEATYNSTLGSNLPLRDQVFFEVSNLVALT